MRLVFTKRNDSNEKPVQPQPPARARPYGDNRIELMEIGGRRQKQTLVLLMMAEIRCLPRRASMTGRIFSDHWKAAIAV